MMLTISHSIAFRTLVLSFHSNRFDYLLVSIFSLLLCCSNANQIQNLNHLHLKSMWIKLLCVVSFCFCLLLLLLFTKAIVTIYLLKSDCQKSNAHNLFICCYVLLVVRSNSEMLDHTNTEVKRIALVFCLQIVVYVFGFYIVSSSSHVEFCPHISLAIINYFK